LSLDDDNAQRQDTTTTHKNAQRRMQHMTIKTRRDNIRWRRGTTTYDDDDARQCTTKK